MQTFEDASLVLIGSTHPITWYDCAGPFGSSILWRKST